MKNDLNINGVTYYDVAKLKVKRSGENTYAELVDTSDANAIASEIMSGKTGYVNGTKVIGTYTPPTIVSPAATGSIIVSDGNQQLLENVISFFDEYGMLLHTVDTTDTSAFPLSELPSLPTAITGYTFSWNKTLSEVNDMTTGGCVYTRVVASALSPTVLIPHDIGWYNGGFTLAFKGVGESVTLTIDWGDGSTASTVNVSGTRGVTSSHTFSALSHNPITITPSTDNKYGLGTGASGNGLLGNTFTNQFVRLKEVRIGAGAIIQDYAFSSYYGLRNMIIPEGITSIPRYAFYRDYSLISINIPNGVTDIVEHAIEQCYGLLEAILPSTITNIGNYVFQNCNALKSIAIPSSAVAMGISVFLGCYSLPEISIPNTITSFGANMFTSCSSLRKVTLGNGITSIPDGTFFSCHTLATIDLPTTITSIGQGAFNECRALSSIDITNVIAISNQAFNGCSSLQTVTIGTALTTIGASAFAGCYSLAAITLPSSVTNIGNNAFSGCNSLQVLAVNSITPPTLGSNAISQGYTGIYYLEITVPSESLNAYKTATNWVAYAENIVGV